MREMYFESEELTKTNQLNELLLTGLRTKWGIDFKVINTNYNYDIMSLFHEDIKYWVSLNWMEIHDSNMKLTDKGMLFADYISSTLFKS